MTTEKNATEVAKEREIGGTVLESILRQRVGTGVVTDAKIAIGLRSTTRTSPNKLETMLRRKKVGSS